jgi:hypothetical protein
MECQDVRQLLAFLERKSEELDAAEGAALQKHLDACPDCAALAASERSADQAIGAALRNVAVPAGLKQQVLRRLAAQRGGAPWKRWAVGAAVAAMLLVAIGGAWAFWPKPEFTVPVERSDWTQPEVQRYLNERGVTVPAPGKFKYGQLRQVDVVLIHGRPVAKLTFERNDGALAIVFFVDTKQFTLNEDDPSIRILPVDGDEGRFKYLIRWQGGDINWLMQEVI